MVIWKKSIALIIVAIIVFSAGFGLGRYVYYYRSQPATLTTIRQNNPEYPFISALLIAGVSGQEPYPEYQPLANTVGAYIKQAESAQNVTDISVYFRDLNSGRWTGVNENDEYSPASMLKIAVMIACLREADVDPSFLDKKLYMEPQSADLNAGEYYPPQNPIVVGQQYTVQQLITDMIVNSDNNAEGLLTYTIGNDAVSKVFQDLQLPNPNSGDFLSPRLYSRFYRVLYNSTYLSYALSNQTLQLLSQTNFTEGLEDGLPASTTVSHKFGERTALTSTGTVDYRELHDCGIVYYPNDPYFICVMTKGSDFSKLQSVISYISKIVWNDVENQNKNSQNQTP
jgi:beta-lactamase class A